MIKPELTRFQMEIKTVLLHASKTNQTGFGIGPKTFYTVNMTVFVYEFILAVLRPVVLLIAKDYKTIIAVPAVRKNNTFRIYAAPNNVL